MKINGVFSLKVFENGLLVNEYVDKNLFLDKGLEYISKLLSFETTDEIVSIIFGEDGTAPAPDDASITLGFRKNIASKVSSSAGVVDIEWELDTTEGNGLEIAEFGLMTDANDLIARKTGVTISKSSSVSLTGTWTLEITR
jgi:hypothetical protein